MLTPSISSAPQLVAPPSPARAARAAIAWGSRLLAFAGSLERALMMVGTSIRATAERSAAIRHLADMDDSLLRDIGIERSEIRQVVRFGRRF